eukprot:373882-Rhodomonas_salina.1
MARLLSGERKRRATRDGRLAHGPTTGSGDRFGKPGRWRGVPLVDGKIQFQCGAPMQCDSFSAIPI